jgi:hypothetical protein
VGGKRLAAFDRYLKLPIGKLSIQMRLQQFLLKSRPDGKTGCVGTLGNDAEHAVPWPRHRVDAGPSLHPHQLGHLDDRQVYSSCATHAQPIQAQATSQSFIDLRLQFVSFFGEAIAGGEYPGLPFSKNGHGSFAS